MDTSRQILYLPHVLPCPGPGLCDTHSSIFGQLDGENANSSESSSWRCETCQRHHPITIAPASQTHSTSASLSRLELLPTELLDEIAAYLSLYRRVLPLCSRTLFAKIGTERLDQPGPVSKSHLVSVLGKDLPAYAPCTICKVLRHHKSSFAWPLLKVHRTEKEIPGSVYAVSEFLTSKLKTELNKGPDAQMCLSLLECKGTYWKPWSANQDSVTNLGFSSVDWEKGLAIQYEASARVITMGTPSPKGNGTENGLVTQVEYSITLPKPWTSFSISQRYIILRDLYLCPHTYASQVQYRDQSDPTYPANSSIAHWLPHHEPIPTVMWKCPQCPTDIVGSFNGTRAGDHGVFFQVWQQSAGKCNDDIREMAICQTFDQGTRFGRVKDLFEQAGSG